MSQSLTASVIVPVHHDAGRLTCFEAAMMGINLGPL